MYRGKHTHQERGRSKKHSSGALVLLLTTVLLVGGVVGGTVAWLIADTDPVVNTFTYGDINLKLEETETDEKGTPFDKNGDGDLKTSAGNEYEMVPGEEYLKDPVVTVLEGNEACWLFVKLVEEGGVPIPNADGTITTYDFDSYLTYDVLVKDENTDGWLQLIGDDGNAVEGIYFRQVGEDTDGIKVSYEVLKGNKISVKDTVTKDMLNALDNNGQDTEATTYPKLSITAYAVQYNGFEPEVSDEAAEPTADQLNAAALKAWKAVEAENATATS